jgi:subtilisin-like proprotein convertase family protein
VASAAESKDTGATFTFDYTIPRISGSSRVGDPFNIIDCFLAGAEQAYLRTGSKTPPLVSYWYDGSGMGTGFYSDLSIRLLGGDAGSPTTGDNDGYDDTVLIHEYGHFLAHHYSEDDTPGGGHSVTWYYISTLTWSEGWANFWALAVRNNMLYWDATQGDAGFWINFETGEASFGEYSDVFVGMNNEAAVAMALYDIFDDAASEDLTPGTDDDSFDYGLADIWTVFDASMDDPVLLVTMLDFFEGWETLFPDEDVDEAFLDRSMEFVGNGTDTVLLNYPRNVFIPDGPPAGVADGLWVSDFTENITDVRVFVSIRHTNIGQLRVKIRHPDGTEVSLHDRTGSFDRNLIEWYGYPNYSLEAGDLAVLSGKPINGMWELVVSDEVPGTAGEVKAWGLRFQNASPDSPATGVDGPLWVAY